MEKFTKLDLRFRVNKINNFHYALVLGAVIVGTSYKIYTDNKVKFEATEYELVRGKMVERKDPPTLPPPKDPKNTEGGQKKNAKPKNEKNDGLKGEKPSPPLQPSKVVQNTQVKKISPSDFIEKWSDVAVSEMKRTGVLASITLAQGCLESDFGNSDVAKQTNNHFGVKCVSKKCKSGHCTLIQVVHAGDSHKDFYMNYVSARRSFSDHSDFLVRNGYFKAAKGSNRYKDWAYMLQKKGYATDPTYAESLIRIIETYQLSRFDI